MNDLPDQTLCPTTAEPSSPVETIGNVVDLTQGRGGSGREDKRHEYN